MNAQHWMLNAKVASGCLSLAHSCRGRVRRHVRSCESRHRIPRRIRWSTDRRGSPGLSSHFWPMAEDGWLWLDETDWGRSRWGDPM